MVLTTDAFEPGGPIPKLHTCEGEDSSPTLAWDEVPEGTRAFALVCDDPDAPGGTFTHWLVYDLPEKARALPRSLPKTAAVLGGGVQGTNDFGRLGYGGPCPPSGTHRYVFTLYALDRPLGLEPGAKKSELARALKGRVLAQAELVGRYKKAGAAALRR